MKGYHMTKQTYTNSMEQSLFKSRQYSQQPINGTYPEQISPPHVPVKGVNFGLLMP